ncbi:MAG: prolyl oligopeptidase family serine peptidase [Acidobacteriota bacterium]
MLKRTFKLLLVVCACAGFSLLPAGRTVAGPGKGHLAPPPVAPVKPVTTDYFGTKVVDPYRYMENLKNPEVQAWMKGQGDYARAVLERIPGREKLLERISQLDQSTTRVKAERLPGNLYAIEKELPGDNAMKLYLQRGLAGKDKLLVDPGKIKLTPADQGKGKNVIEGYALSNNLQYVAVGIEPGGDELVGELHVIDVATGRETGDVMTHVGAEAWEPNWLPDNHAFVYGRLQHLPPGAPPAEVRQKFRSYLHVLGKNPANDKAVFGYGVVPSIHVKPSEIASVQTQPDSRWALGIITGSVTPNGAYYIEPVSDLGKKNSAWKKIAGFSDGVSDIEVHGDELYVLTYNNAPRYKVLLTSALDPDLATAETIVPPGQAVVTGISAAQDALYVQLMDGALSRLLRVPYGPHPKVEQVPLPFDGAIRGMSTDPRVPGALLSMSSWTRAREIYAYNPRTKRVTNTKLQPAGPYDDPTNIKSVEVKARSYDGTMVPLSIVYPKKLKLDGANPTWLRGYGGYGFTFRPSFNPRMLAWFEQGGVYAVCHVRGGGIYGEQWHLAGKGANKPNTWRDFIACAQYLIKHKYTSPAHLAGMGTSAGGILIGRAITTRPDLFAAAVDWVGVSDTLRFQTTQNGETNIPELGSVKTQAGFKALYAMSPYAHIKAGTPYPAVLFMTGMNDPRVDPWQMDKMAARMEAATSSGKPVLLRVTYHAGHNTMGATRTQDEKMFADIFSFMLWQFDEPGFQPKK